MQAERSAHLSFWSTCKYQLATAVHAGPVVVVRLSPLQRTVLLAMLGSKTEVLTLDGLRQIVDLADEQAEHDGGNAGTSGQQEGHRGDGDVERKDLIHWSFSLCCVGFRSSRLQS